MILKSSGYTLCTYRSFSCYPHRGGIFSAYTGINTVVALFYSNQIRVSSPCFKVLSTRFAPLPTRGVHELLTRANPDQEFVISNPKVRITCLRGTFLFPQKCHYNILISTSTPLGRFKFMSASMAFGVVFKISIKRL